MPKKNKYCVGQKFFNLTLLGKTKEKRGNKILWSALCNCGNVTNIIPYEIRIGHTKTCGQCSSTSQFKDITGTKFHNLTFIKPHSKTRNDQMKWEALCDCGKTTITIPSNKAKSCGCLAKQKSRDRCAKLGKAGRKYHPMISSARHLWRAYKRDGNVDFETFYQLSQLPCFYCGKLPSNQYNHKDNCGRIYLEGLFIYNGLDRINPKIGHNVDNIVPCCYDCNTAKMQRTVDQFLIHVKSIYEYNIDKIKNL